MDSAVKFLRDDAYGNFIIIKIPGIEIIPEHEQHEAVMREERSRQLAAGALDADAVCARLRSITPPLDPEEEDNETRLLETKARRELENDGCPACYPPELSVPVQEAPEEYRLIIEHWKSFSSTGDVVLCAQRSDWQKFRAAQKHIRNRYPHQSFQKFLDSVRERRRRHLLDDGVELLSDWRQQTWQQNWIEFQDHHFVSYEELQRERDRLKEHLDTLKKESSAVDRENPQHLAQERSIQTSLEFSGRKLHWKKVLLEWIGRQQVGRIPEPARPVKEADDQNGMLASAVKAALSPRRLRPRQKADSDTLAVLGKARVSKAEPKRRNQRTRTQKKLKTQKKSKAGPVNADLEVTTSNRAQMTSKERQAIKPARTKGKSRDRFDTLSPRAQRVSKKNRRAQPNRQQLNPPIKIVKTKSGRESKPLVKFS